MLTWKLRITVLWLVAAVSQSAAMALFMLEPGVIRDMMAGERQGANTHSAAVQINIALFWVVPLTMAFLTLVLKDTVSRWTNAVLGALFVFWWTIGIWANVLAGTFHSGNTFFALVQSLVPLLIVWHVWRWPHPSEVTPPQPRQETTLH